MVLKELLNAKNDKYDEFENPTAFEKEDCLSCRILGMLPDRISPTAKTLDQGTHNRQDLRLWCHWADTHISRAWNNLRHNGRLSSSANQSTNMVRDSLGSCPCQRLWSALEFIECSINMDSYMAAWECHREFQLYQKPEAKRNYIVAHNLFSDSFRGFILINMFECILSWLLISLHKSPLSQ